MTMPDRPKAWEDLVDAIILMGRHPTSETSPFNCNHDELQVLSDASKFTPEEIARLESLGFFVDEYGGFQSFRYGSA